ncbi:MAG TPA: glycoside hydrolase family 95 protein, partial [Chthonomonadales bacterium]|nr:glycoside hydrolase family 95 protein [Chthonomonadales bacterium]
MEKHFGRAADWQSCRLWRRKPSIDWTDAMPVGNGRLGAMVFGGVANDRFQLNENTLWAGGPQDSTNPEALKHLPEVRRLIFENKNLQAQEIAGRYLLGIPHGVKSYQTLGDLWIDWEIEGSPDSYLRQLDLDSAIASVQFRAGGISFTREVFASCPDQALVMRFTADRPRSLTARIRLNRVQDSSTRAAGENLLLMHGRIAADAQGEPDGISFACALEARGSGGSVRASQDALELKGCNSVTLLIAAATSRRYQAPAEECRSRLAELSGKRYHSLRSAHLADHRKLFRRVSLSLGAPPNLPVDERIARVRAGEEDPDLAALYFQFGRYLLISSSRPGNLPANLQGIWNDHINAPWNSDFHTNINLQMNYWLAEPANLAECHKPLFDLIGSLVPSGSRTARVHYGAGGFVEHHLTDAWGYTTPADGVWGIWPMGAAWLCTHLWGHYLYMPDKGFLRDTAYPLMKSAAQFLLDFLVVDPHGRLVTNPSHSPENSFRLLNGDVCQLSYAATMDLEIIRELFQACIQAGETLDIDPDFRFGVASALDRL